MRTKLIIVIMQCFFYAAFSETHNSDSSFSIIEGGYGNKPILWFKPKADGSGDTPVDVVKQFLEFVKHSQVEEAKALCVSAEDKDGEPPQRHSAIEEGVFDQYVERVRNERIAKINVSKFAIRGKAGYWRVDLLITKKDGAKIEVDINLKKFDGSWKIQERHVWFDYAKGGANRFIF